jgi:hypothetical protein
VWRAYLTAGFAELEHYRPVGLSRRAALAGSVVVEAPPVAGRNGPAMLLRNSVGTATSLNYNQHCGDPRRQSSLCWRPRCACCNGGVRRLAGRGAYRCRPLQPRRSRRCLIAGINRSRRVIRTRWSPTTPALDPVADGFNSATAAEEDYSAFSGEQALGQDRHARHRLGCNSAVDAGLSFTFAKPGTWSRPLHLYSSLDGSSGSSHHLFGHAREIAAAVRQAIVRIPGRSYADGLPRGARPAGR